MALLCSESRPEECHRSRLVGAALEAEGIAVTHLDEDDRPVGQKEVMTRVLHGQQTLFEDMLPGKMVRSKARFRPTEE